MTACSKEKKERGLKQVHKCAISFSILEIIKHKKWTPFFFIHPEYVYVHDSHDNVRGNKVKRVDIFSFILNSISYNSSFESILSRIHVK